MQDEETAAAAAETVLAPAAVEQLIANRRAFVAFVERRIGNAALAEEIVQEAFVRALDRGAEISDSVLGWFYQVLRNAVIDRQRRQAVANRGLERFASELAAGEEGVAAPDQGLQSAVCRCVGELAGQLKPEYADALRRIEIDGVPVKDYAEAAGISAANAGVRIFRARAALRRQLELLCRTCANHGCIDCTCQPACT